MFNLFKKKKSETVGLYKDAAVYANTPSVILDSENLLVIFCRDDGIIASREHKTAAGFVSDDYGLFSSAEEIINHFAIVDTAAQARVLEIVAAGEL